MGVHNTLTVEKKHREICERSPEWKPQLGHETNLQKINENYGREDSDFIAM